VPCLIEAKRAPGRPRVTSSRRSILFRPFSCGHPLLPAQGREILPFELLNTTY